MTSALPAQRIEFIPIERISIVNPRVRNKRVFKEIVESISKVGLKRPITVSRRAEADGPYYDLVCGQGRLEAYQTLGQREVPALVVTADPEDCLVASLVENCARRQHKALDLLQDIGGMRQRGYPISEIARRTGLTAEYVGWVSHLLETGEQRLLQSVESGTIPLNIAIEIADASDQDVQAALTSAYEQGLLKGRKLVAAKKLIEIRRRRGKGLDWGKDKMRQQVSADALVKAYQEESDRKRVMIRRTEITRSRLIFITEALRKLSRDERFVALLEDEELAMLPENIAARLGALEGTL
ncbi:plasmid partitioning protein RepB C-terminal domain-containing protein [Sphingobium sp. TomTYG45]